jgi:hypothetical protein
LAGATKCQRCVTSGRARRTIGWIYRRVRRPGGVAYRPAEVLA